jgi:hypothetical protein
MTMKSKWKIKIEHLMACNCEWGCPCSFDAPPTYGNCDSAIAYRIVEGKFSKVSLDGLRWVLAASWPGPLHEGKGKAVVYLDSRAKGEKRAALQAIATGAAGGPIGIFMSTITNGLAVETAEISFKYAGKRSQFSAGKPVKVMFKPIENPVTKSEHPVTVLLPTGLLAKKEDHYSSKVFSVLADGLDYSYSERTAIAFSNTWTGP